MPATQARTRRRLETVPVTGTTVPNLPGQRGSVVPKEILDLATELFTLNWTQNKAKRNYDKTRTLLYQKMKEAGIQSFELKGVGEDGKLVDCDALIGAAVGTVVSISKLRKLVSDEQFLKIVSASNKAVTDIVGTAILNQCLVPTVGDENVSVRARK